ncbi:MAG: gephyrin-like molybdotransferase Glp [bacterium]
MIPFAQAYDIMLQAASLLGTEQVPLIDAAGRILAQDVTADISMPPFDKSAMDGYACRRVDLGRPLTIIETIPAGRMPTLPVGLGQCAKIMTGAPVPRGADCVIMQEYTDAPTPDTIQFNGRTTESNICRAGEDLTCGDLVLRRGARIGPAQLAVLASVGVPCPLVARQPRVAIAATGSELVTAEEKPTGAMIRDSNSVQLHTQVQGVGAIATRLGIIPDTAEALSSAIQHAMPHHDLILLSGGVSTGAFDFVPATLQQCGFELLFESVAMQPGKPMVFGRHPNGVFCCGLPGNPVSTYVVFELLLKPFLLKQMGHVHIPTLAAARMGERFERRRTDRQNTIPVRFQTPDVVVPVTYHGSAHIHAMCAADALLIVPVGVSNIAEGEAVHVRLP